MIVATLAYKIVVECKLDGSRIIEMMKNHFDYQHVVLFLLFNFLDIANHTWFIFALCYVYLLAPAIVNHYIRRKKWLLHASITVLILVYVFTALFLKYIDFSNNYIITRNWLFEGVPAFVLGVCLCDKQDIIKSIVRRIGKYKLLLIAVFFHALIFFDAYITSEMGVVQEFYLFSPFLTMVLIAISSAYPCSNIGKKALCLLGDKCPTIIYMFHPLVILLVDRVIRKLLGDGEFYFLSFLSTLFIVLILCVLYNKLTKFKNTV